MELCATITCTGDGRPCECNSRGKWDCGPVGPKADHGQLVSSVPNEESTADSVGRSWAFSNGRSSKVYSYVRYRDTNILTSHPTCCLARANSISGFQSPYTDEQIGSEVISNPVPINACQLSPPDPSATHVGMRSSHRGDLPS